MWLIISGWTQFYAHFFSAWIREDEKLNPQSPIKGLSLCDIFNPSAQIDWSLGGWAHLYWKEGHFQVMYGTDTDLNWWHMAQWNSEQTDVLLVRGSDSCPAAPGSNSSPLTAFQSGLSVCITAMERRQWSEISGSAAPICMGSKEDLCNIAFYNTLQQLYIDHTHLCINTECGSNNSALRRHRRISLLHIDSELWNQQQLYGRWNQ